MIKNIVFDMGQVLTRFDPDSIIRHFVADPLDVKLIRNEVFEKSEWQELDRGTFMEEDILSAVCARLPERLHSSTSNLLLHWREYMDVLENIVPLIQQLKNNGYSIFLLSNAGKSMLRFTYKLPVLQLFSGILFSAQVYLLKPDPKIYLEFFNRFSLNPTECYFIDDRLDNIETGRKLGMDGFCYGGEILPLYTAMKNAGISVSGNLNE